MKTFVIENIFQLYGYVFVIMVTPFLFKCVYDYGRIVLSKN